MRRIAIVAIFALASFGESSAQGLGDLLVVPSRVVIEGPKRNEVLTLVNRGTDTASYSISFVQYAMTETGQLQEITEPQPGQLFADKIVRFFPKQVTLAPGESQNVRLQIIKPADLPAGEYRSHLYFRALVPDALLDTTKRDTSSTGLSVKLTAVFGVSIPIIVRNGDLSATASISNIALGTDPKNPAKHVVNLQLHREGNESLYGDFQVTFKPNTGGEEITIASQKGLGIYTPIHDRQVQLALLPVDLALLKNGVVTATYKSRASVDSQEGAVLARATAVLP